MLLKNARNGKFEPPGGLCDQADEDASHTAARETAEELLGVEEDKSSAAGKNLLELARSNNRWSGPYGTPPFIPHQAFILITDGQILPSIDELVTNFEPNAEASAAILVPLRSMDGNAMTVKPFGDGEPLQLRNKIGFARVREMKRLDREDLIPRIVDI